MIKRGVFDTPACSGEVMRMTVNQKNQTIERFRIDPKKAHNGFRDYKESFQKGIVGINDLLFVPVEWKVLSEEKPVTFNSKGEVLEGLCEIQNFRIYKVNGLEELSVYLSTNSYDKGGKPKKKLQGETWYIAEKV